MYKKIRLSNDFTLSIHGRHEFNLAKSCQTYKYSHHKGCISYEDLFFDKKKKDLKQRIILYDPIDWKKTNKQANTFVLPILFQYFFFSLSIFLLVVARIRRL